jgi:hypothetical protein
MAVVFLIQIAGLFQVSRIDSLAGRGKEEASGEINPQKL